MELGTIFIETDELWLNIKENGNTALGVLP